MMLRTNVLLLIGFIASFVTAGTVRTMGNSRIIGGTVASTGEYPSQLSLQFNGVHRCGASQIRGFWALTTAYCVFGLLDTNFTLVSGTNNLNGGTRHVVNGIEIHPNYHADISWENDIALLHTSTAMEGDLVQPIKIPDSVVVVPVGTQVTVVGWGSHEEGGPISDQLYEAELEISNHETCTIRYEEFGETITEKQICAASTTGKRGSCTGDTGGPLLWIREDDPAPQPNLLVGLVSWGLGCARPGYPTVYTNVASYCVWILGVAGGSICQPSIPNP